LCKEDPGSDCDAAQILRHLVSTHAAKTGLVALPHWERFSYAGNFAEIFYIARPEFLAQFLKHPEVMRGTNSLREVDLDADSESEIATGNEHDVVF